MRLRRLSANQPGFKNVDFRDGFNLVVAERTKESTKKDSRNGLGKSTLIELIHFCLGKGTQKGQVPVVDDLEGWEFSLELQLFGDRVTLSRAVDDQRRVAVAGEFSRWPVAPEWDADQTKFFISLAGLRDNLARDFFSLGSEDALPKYSPTFRSLLSYFSRRGKDAYSSPFEHHRKQREWDKQVNVAFLLDLSWQDAAAWQVLKDEKAVVDQLARAVKDGVLPDYLGTEGALETERVRLTEQIERQEAELEAFRVHENYRDIEAAANDLTEHMHQLANENFSDRQSIDLYRAASEEEAATTATKAQLEAVFAEVNLEFPNAVVRRLDDVAEFHRQVIANRREYLLEEIERLEQVCRERDAVIERLDAERASHMVVLRTHGALEEFQQLQGRLTDTRGALRDIEARMERLKELTEAKDRYGRRVKDLEAGARRRYGLRLRDEGARHPTPASGKINRHDQPTRGGATSSRRAGATASRRADQVCAGRLASVKPAASDARSVRWMQPGLVQLFAHALGANSLAPPRKASASSAPARTTECRPERARVDAASRRSLLAHNRKWT